MIYGGGGAAILDNGVKSQLVPVSGVVEAAAIKENGAIRLLVLGHRRRHLRIIDARGRVLYSIGAAAPVLAGASQFALSANGHSVFIQDASTLRVYRAASSQGP